METAIDIVGISLRLTARARVSPAARASAHPNWASAESAEKIAGGRANGGPSLGALRRKVRRFRTIRTLAGADLTPGCSAPTAKEDLMRIYTARDAAKKFGALLEDADAGPVTILKSGRPRAVLISKRTFEQYQRAYEKEQEEQFADLVFKGIDLIRDGKLCEGERALALTRRLQMKELRPGDAKAIGKLLGEPGK